MSNEIEYATKKAPDNAYFQQERLQDADSGGMKISLII